MLSHLLRETFSLLVTLFVVLSLVFVGMRALPGDAASLRGGTDATQAQVTALRRSLGLDQPLSRQYAAYWQDLVTGDLGESIRERRAVASILLERLPVTLMLAGTAFTLSTLVGLGLGILAGSLPGGPADRGVLGLTTVGLTLPEFWFGFLLLLGFAVTLRWFPLIGFPADGTTLAALHHLTLPALTLAVPRAAQVARLARAQLLEERSADYVRTARSKGLRSLNVTRHIASNALPGLFPLLALQLGGLLTGTIVVEQVFGLPGLGLTLLGAIGARDYPVVQGVTLLAVVVYLLVNWLADIAQLLTDPRLRYG